MIEAHDGVTLDEILAPPDTHDFKPFLREILNRQPDVLVQSWAGAGNKQLFSDMREVGIFDRMKVTGGLGDREARHALGLDAVGMVGICKYSPILPDNPINDWLRQKHFARYGQDPDLFTGGGFAAGLALVEGLKRCEGNTSPEALIPVFEGMSFEGPKGAYTFRIEDHQALQPMYVVEMVEDPPPGHSWGIPRLIAEISAEESGPPVMVKQE